MDNSSPPRPPNPLAFFNPVSALEVNSSLAQAAADPSPHDPHAVFIHPPFNDFPDSDLHPDGLTFAILAANPDWFLDPGDFISPANSGGPPSKPDAVQYPAKLEPPRKRNLKALGADGLTDNGEPRFRCTFCRKSYAGDNAKSMWRRHVVKRHYIAMSNRREVKRGFRLGPRRSVNGEFFFPLPIISAIYSFVFGGSVKAEDDGDSDGSDGGSANELDDHSPSHTPERGSASTASVSGSASAGPSNPKSRTKRLKGESASSMPNPLDPNSIHRPMIPGTHTIKWPTDPIPPSQIQQPQPQQWNRTAAAAFVGAAIRQMVETAYKNVREYNDGDEDFLMDMTPDGTGAGPSTRRVFDPLAPPKSQVRLTLICLS